jgi:hypothetical protein
VYTFRKGQESNPVMEPIGTIFNRIVRDIGLENARKINVIRKKWAELVGEVISNHAYPETLKGDMLILTVESPQWMHHLTFYKDEIITRLNTLGIKRVNFRLGKLPVYTNTTTKVKEIPLTENDKEYVNDILKDIKDDELRERLKRLLLHGLTRGKKS